MKRLLMLRVIVGTGRHRHGRSWPASSTGRPAARWSCARGPESRRPTQLSSGQRRAEKVADNLYMIPGQGGNTAAFVTR